MNKSQVESHYGQSGLTIETKFGTYTNATISLDSNPYHGYPHRVRGNKDGWNAIEGLVHASEIKSIRQSVDQIRTSLIAALTAKKDVEIDYTDVDGDKTTRVITPEHIFISVEGEQLKGRCHLRDAVRSFKIDRIEEVREPKSVFHKLGSRFTYEGTEYMLARFENQKVGLINTANGNRWGDPVPVVDHWNISAAEFAKFTFASEFKKVNA